MQIQGYFDLRFEALKDAFAELFDDPQERGAALCVQVGGETVVDIWAGTADKDGAGLAQRHHPQPVLLHQDLRRRRRPAAGRAGQARTGRSRGPLVAEFAAAGKERVTLRQLLSHRAGLPALHAPLPAEALYDWRR